MKHLLLIAVLVLVVTSGWGQTMTIKNNELQVSQPVMFVGKTAELSPGSSVPLNEILAYLNDKTYISLMRIEGHADDYSNNQELSEQRALAVSKWLVTHGVDCKRLIAVGFGNTKPVSEDKAANTRVVFSNAMLRGRAIGGMEVDGGGKVAGDPCK